MGINKVQINRNGQFDVLIDLSEDTIAEDKMLKGIKGHDANGDEVEGTIETKTSNDLTASGAIVTVPSGYYESNTTKSVSTTTQATPSVSINSSGLITASATQSAGYVSAGTKSGTKQLTTQAAKTITPSTSSQTAVAKNVYTTGVVTVNAIPDSYIQPSGSLEVTENGTHDVTSYASVEVNVPSGGSGSGGGSDSGIQYEVITIPAGATSATYTLPRVTNGAGTMYYGVTISEKKDTYLPIGISDTHVLYTQSFSTGSNAMVTFEYADVYYDQGTITWEDAPAFKEDLTLVLVNDPSKDPLWTCTPS